MFFSAYAPSVFRDRLRRRNTNHMAPKMPIPTTAATMPPMIAPTGVLCGLSTAAASCEASGTLAAVVVCQTVVTAVTSTASAPPSGGAAVRVTVTVSVFSQSTTLCCRLTIFAGRGDDGSAAGVAVGETVVQAVTVAQCLVVARAAVWATVTVFVIVLIRSGVQVKAESLVIQQTSPLLQTSQPRSSACRLGRCRRGRLRFVGLDVHSPPGGLWHSLADTVSRNVAATTAIAMTTRNWELVVCSRMAKRCSARRGGGGQKHKKLFSFPGEGGRPGGGIRKAGQKAITYRSPRTGVSTASTGVVGRGWLSASRIANREQLAQHGHR